MTSVPGEGRRACPRLPGASRFPVVRGRAREGALTLPELLAVLAIVALLAGLSLGLMASLPARFAHEQAANSVRALIRRARAAAIETRSGASLVLEGRRFEARSFRALALFRMEDLAPSLDDPRMLVTTGGRGMLGRVFRATSDQGRLGMALYFEEPGAYVDLGNAPFLSPPDGVRLEAFLLVGDLASYKTSEEGRRRPRPVALPGLSPPKKAEAKPEEPLRFLIASKGEEYWLRIRDDYALEGGVSGAGAVAAFRETPPGALAPGRWTQVALEFDGEDLKILVGGLRCDRVPTGAAKLPRRLAPSEAPLRISSAEPALSLLGAVDEFKLSGIVAEASIELPGEVEVEAPPAIRFDGRGELDPLYHDAPVIVRLSPVTVRDGPRGRSLAASSAPAEIVVGRSGAIW